MKPFATFAGGVVCLVVSAGISTEMKSLDDSTLVGISGQRGLTMELDLGLTLGVVGSALAPDWNFRLADISYKEDDTRVIFSGLQSWVRATPIP